MATADELLNSLAETVPVHTHQVVDPDSYFVIDPDTRLMSNGSLTPNVIMQYDHNSERYTFELPRYVEGHDMTLCNRVKVHYNNINSEHGIETRDVHELDDLRVDPNNKDNVICSWLIPRNATQQPGILSFLVQYLCIIDGEEVYEWHTDIYSDVEVRPGRDNGEQSVIEYTGLLEQWRESLFGTKDSLVADLQSTSQTQQDEIEAKGAATLASIPEDYTTTHAMADEALRRKADAIIMSDSGEYIFLDDSSDCNLLGLKLFGKTTQIKTTGNQLLPIDYVATSADRGLRRTVVDGMCFVRGTAISDASFKVTLLGNYTSTDRLFTLSPGTYTVTDCSISSYDGTNRITYTNQTFTVDTDFNITWVSTRTYNPGEVVYERTYPMINVGTSPKTWERFSNFKASPTINNPQSLEHITDPVVKLYSKNLLDASNILVGANKTINVSEDGYQITVTGGSNNPYTSSMVALDIGFIKGKTLILKANEISSTNNDAKPGVQLNIQGPNGWMYDALTPTKLSLRCEIPEDVLNVTVGVYTNNTNTPLSVDNTVTVNGVGVYFEDSNWEPYHRTNTLSLSRVLNGIPVESGGNYTDANGQQWVCDEVDFERGKFIRRVGTTEFTDSTWANTGAGKYFANIDRDKYSSEYAVLCTHVNGGTQSDGGKNNVIFINANNDIRLNTTIGTAEVEDITSIMNDAVLCGVLITPIETDLTETELEAFRTLHTNATNTTILNDQNVKMEVKYVADLERYIFNNVSTKQRQFDLTLKEANWVVSSDGRYYSQTLDIDARPNGEINLKPTAAQQVSLILDGIAMFIANENGVCTAYSIGGTPGKDITIPATETVVVYA